MCERRCVYVSVGEHPLPRRLSEPRLPGRLILARSSRSALTAPPLSTRARLPARPVRQTPSPDPLLATEGPAAFVLTPSSFPHPPPSQPWLGAGGWARELPPHAPLPPALQPRLLGPEPRLVTEVPAPTLDPPSGPFPKLQPRGPHKRQLKLVSPGFNALPQLP